MYLNHLFSYLQIAIECSTLLLLGQKFFDLGKFKLYRYLIAAAALSCELIFIRTIDLEHTISATIFIISLSAVYTFCFKVKVVYALILTIFLKQIRFMILAVVQFLFPGEISLFVENFTSLLILSLVLIIVRYRVTFTYLRSEYIYHKYARMLIYTSLALFIFEVVVKENVINGSILTSVIFAASSAIMIIAVSLKLEFTN